jgi:hypothetical protein
VPAGVDEFAEMYALSRKLEMMGYVCNALTLRLGVEAIDDNHVARQIDEVRQMLLTMQAGATR